ncbi:MAG: hypothetical protein II189_05525 [Lachnospiraceae bacterium]|nr:hypothetical protein [Lachnospiraceae bacterium]MBQ3975311.1 hypothetical protein [Lachnospiraceae bacterium]
MDLTKKSGGIFNGRGTVYNGNQKAQKKGSKRTDGKNSDRDGKESITPPIPSEWMGLAEEMTISYL